MARLSPLLVLFSLLSTTLVTVSAQFNQTEQHINAQCDNGCFFSSFPGGSCTNDPACMCDQQKYRETYFCCIGEKCAASVLPDAIQRQNSACEARNMPFTFDAEAVCGIKLTTSSTILASATSTATGDSESSAAPASTSASSSTVTSGALSTESQTSSGGSTPTPTANSAPVKKVMLKAAVILVAASGLLC